MTPGGERWAGHSETSHGADRGEDKSDGLCALRRQWPAILLDGKSLGAKLEPVSATAVVYAENLGRVGKVSRYVSVSDGLWWVTREPHNLEESLLFRSDWATDENEFRKSRGRGGAAAPRPSRG